MRKPGLMRWWAPGRAYGAPVRWLRVLAAAAAAAAAASATYMLFEAQWVRCRRADLQVPGLDPAYRGLTILHLCDVHAGFFPTNERALRKVVDWAVPLAPDLVLLTGDVLGQRRRSRRCLDLLTRVRPRLGTYAVTGNHEYGLSKSPFARARDSSAMWHEASITLLADTCVRVSVESGDRNTAPLAGAGQESAEGTSKAPGQEAAPVRKTAHLTLCGADHLTGGYPLAQQASPSDELSILLVHEPPPADSPLAGRFELAFAGHTHGGQLRIPSRTGLTPLAKEGDERLSGIHEWGRTQLIISRGVGTSFLPFRLLTRPEATLWRLV
jgi:predicted MPP superfamily phosphohydrolase